MIDAYGHELSAIWSDESIVVGKKVCRPPNASRRLRQDMPHLAQVRAPGFSRIWIAHQLDRWTSGVIVVPRTAEAYRGLNLQFEAAALRWLHSRRQGA